VRETLEAQLDLTACAEDPEYGDQRWPSSNSEVAGTPLDRLATDPAGRPGPVHAAVVAAL